MARTPTSPNSVHDRADVMHDAHRLDTLCRELIPAAEPFARDAIEKAKLDAGASPAEITHEEIESRAFEIAQVFISAWCAVLQQSLESKRHLSLIDGVFPDEAARTHLRSRLLEAGITDTTVCMAALRNGLLRTADSVALPGEMRLDVIARGHVGDLHVAVVKTAAVKSNASSNDDSERER